MLLLRRDVTGGLRLRGGRAQELQQVALCERPGLRPACDWLQNIGGRDSILVLQEPPSECLDSVWVVGHFGQKSFEQRLRDKARKSAPAVPVAQQSLWSPDTEVSGETRGRPTKTRAALIGGKLQSARVVSLQQTGCEPVLPSPEGTITAGSAGI